MDKSNFSRSQTNSNYSHRNPEYNNPITSIPVYPGTSSHIRKNSADPNYDNHNLARSPDLQTNTAGSSLNPTPHDNNSTGKHINSPSSTKNSVGYSPNPFLSSENPFLSSQTNYPDYKSRIRDVPVYPGLNVYPNAASSADNLGDIQCRSETSASKGSISLLKSFGKSIDSLFTWKSTTTLATTNIPESNFDEDENKERGNWTGRMDFILSCIGFAVGLGNVWRFPYLCYRNGGGAFLIPYTIMLAASGLPLFFMELAIGQFSSRGATGIWNISPLFKGVGYAMIVTSCIVGTYYNMIISYVVRYFIASFALEVPWAHCNNTWNTDSCVEMRNHSIPVNGTKATYPAEEYWQNYILEQSSGIEDLGHLKWELVLCLLFSWVVVFLCLIRGIKSTGKVVYFTATFPYVVLIILLIRGITLPGSADGIRFYFIPKWHKLSDMDVWRDAGVQIFYSLGPGWGGLIVMASYNRFNNNCYRDAMIVAITNCATSVFAGFVIFSMIGFMAHELNLPVANVTDSGPGLAFVAYPAGIAMMPGAPFWAVIFFVMLFTLGLDSMFTGMETVFTALADEFEFCKTNKILITAIVSLISFLLGLVQCTQAGIYWMNLLDQYSAGFTLMTVCLFEVLVIIHIYGINRFCDDIENMIGLRPNIYWRATWCLITPLTIVLLLIFNIWNYRPAKYNAYVYPKWAELIGWGMTVIELVWIPIIAIVVWWRHVGGFKNLTWYLKFPWTGETIKELTKAKASWGPALKEHWVYKSKDASTQTLENDLKQSKYIYDNPALDDSRSSMSFETTI